MSGIGFQELIILFLIGLIVLGPERLPRVANQLGSWLGQARRMTRVMKRQLEEELDLEKQPTIQPPPTTGKSFTPRPEDFPPRPDAELEAEHAPANEHDDTWSPAHEADAPGTGVDDDKFDDELADTAVDEAAADEPPVDDAKEKAS